VLTLAEAAAYLRVGEAEIVQAVRDQGLPARQIGPDWRFLKSALQDWLRSPPRRNRGLLAHLGAVRNDPYLEELLQEVYQRRGRPEAEEG
jgi:excisionase family DNA binding protein